MAREKRTPRPERRRVQPFAKLDETLQKIGEAQKTLMRIEGNRKMRVERINSRAELDSAPHRTRIDELFEEIFQHANERRKLLTQGRRRKKVSLPHGILGWRLTPHKVEFKVDEKTAIANVKSAGLEEKLLHIKEKFRKDALRKEPKLVFQLPSVALSQEEIFYVQPTNLEEIRRNTEPLKKVLL